MGMKHTSKSTVMHFQLVTVNFYYFSKKKIFKKSNKFNAVEPRKVIKMFPKKLFNIL